MKHRIELLSPAGDLQRAKIAIRYGADAVYRGGKKFSLRSRASNFDIEDIAEGGTMNMKSTKGEIYSVTAVFKIPPILHKCRRKGIIHT